MADVPTWLADKFTEVLPMANIESIYGWLTGNSDKIAGLTDHGEKMAVLNTNLWQPLYESACIYSKDEWNANLLGMAPLIDELSQDGFVPSWVGTVDEMGYRRMRQDLGCPWVPTATNGADKNGTTAKKAGFIESLPGWGWALLAGAGTLGLVGTAWAGARVVKALTK